MWTRSGMGFRSRSVLTLCLSVLAATYGSLALASSHDTVVEERNVPYAADDPRQIVHVFGFEPDAEPRPALAIVHGGGLIWGDPDFEEPLARRFHEQGYVTFLLGYRLFDELTGANAWPAPLEDVQRAIRWIRSHADDYGVDPGRVCALGFSAGAHLTSMLGTTDVTIDTDSTLDGFSSRADCVVSMAGDGDLFVPSQNEFWNRLMERIIGGSQSEHPELWRAASPAHNVDADTAPILIVHGADDLDVPVATSRAFVEALTEAGATVDYLELPGYHFDIRDDPRTWERVDAFLAQHLRP